MKVNIKLDIDLENKDLLDLGFHPQVLKKAKKEQEKRNEELKKNFDEMIKSLGDLNFNIDIENSDDYEEV